MNPVAIFSFFVVVVVLLKTVVCSLFLFFFSLFRAGACRALKVLGTQSRTPEYPKVVLVVEKLKMVRVLVGGSPERPPPESNFRMFRLGCFHQWPWFVAWGFYY